MAGIIKSEQLQEVPVTTEGSYKAMMDMKQDLMNLMREEKAEFYEEIGLGYHPKTDSAILIDGEFPPDCLA